MKFFILASAMWLGFSSGMCIEPPPSDGRVQRADYMSSVIKPGDIGAEIGVAAGVFAWHVLLPGQPGKLYLIDPWEYGLQADVELDPTPEKQKCYDSYYEYVRDLFEPYPSVEVVRMKSQDAYVLFPDNYFDYVYIDGEHSYAAVWRDLTNYFSKVKVGGLIIGDDYGWAGIMDAVQDFLKLQGDAVAFTDPFSCTSGGQFVIRRLK